MCRITLLSLLLLSASVFGAESEAAFLKFRKEASLEKKVPGCNVYRIVLDDEVYKNTSSGFSDIRVIDQEERIVPFEIGKAQETRRDTSMPVFSKMLSLRKDTETNSVEIIIEDQSKRDEIAMIRINTHDKNFEKTITVFSGDDNEHWTLNTENAKIFDYSGIADVSCSTVEIKPVRAKYFKIVIGNFTEREKAARSTKNSIIKDGKLCSETINTTELDKAIRIDSIELRYFFMRSYDRLCEYPVIVKSIVSKNKETVITLESDRQPFKSFTIVSDSPGFVRQASVDIPCEDNNYHCIGSEKIFSVDTPGGRKSMTRVAFCSERRSREYRISIANAGNPPLENIRIKAEGCQYQLTLLASAGPGPFYVCYGGDFEAPSYDVAEVLGMMENQVPAFFTLGKQEDNPEFSRPRSALSWNFGKYLFYAGIILLAIVLGIVLAFYFRKIESGVE